MLIKSSSIQHTHNASRLLSLDIFRGLTVALMILVNSPGNNTTYAWLEHSSWNGCTLADLVFPFFIFIVGVASVFSLTKAREVGLSTEELLPKIIKRTLLIFFIGLCLNAFPSHVDLATLRIMGVLQRIAICYFFSAWLFLKTSVKTQVIMMLVILVTYWLLIVLFSEPNYGQTTNFAAYIDRLILSPTHLYVNNFDPEGLFSTLPALATVLIGNLTGIGLLSNLSMQTKLKGMLGTGSVALAIGSCWGIWFPINKTIWTSSYVLWTGGLALWVLAGCYWIIDIKHWRTWSKFFEILGMNALVVYILHVFLLKIQVMITISTPHHGNQNLKLLITDSLFGWASLPNASLLYALSYTLFCFMILAILCRKKISIKL